ncbi:unnamed protein product [Paramecium pentaurelia]|uniref:Flavoprotein domain-containing protein n=1 Tax=Paramecium pentaurelia TaxID=43138 RepID=A0A8S1UJT0_9CILI|nr:unnamed protein product [Paramecium pentaurelia]
MQQDNNQREFKILIGFTGSVASIKAEQLINDIQKKFKEFNYTIKIRIITTQNAQKFMNPQIENIEHFSDEDEFKTWKQRNDPVLHIELRKWADCLLIAPLSANTMAKISNGLCDNLLTNVARAWDYKKPMILAPAMNTMMYENPITFKQINKLQKMGAFIIDSISKTLICGDIGKGAMEETNNISCIVYQRLNDFDAEDVSPWQEMNLSPQSILYKQNQQYRSSTIYSGKDEKQKINNTKTSYSKLTKHTATTTTTEFPIRCLRNRVRSIDQTQKQFLKATPVKQYCDFKLSKELLMYRNTADFPKQTLPRNFLSFQRLKKSYSRKQTVHSQELNPQLLQLQMQMKKMEEQVQQQKKSSWEIGARRLSNPKFQTFLSTQV